MELKRYNIPEISSIYVLTTGSICEGSGTGGAKDPWDEQED